MRHIRAFIAFELPAAIKSELKVAADELAQSLPTKSVRWVPPENIHLTLRFLGDTPVDKLSSVAAAIATVATAHPQFDLFLSGLGCFPNKSRPRVFWIGLDGDIANLERIQSHLSQELATIGWELERRRFHPHLTVGRVKDRRAIARANYDWGLSIKPILFRVSRLILFESDLRPGGAIYHIRHSSTLREPEDKI